MNWNLFLYASSWRICSYYVLLYPQIILPSFATTHINHRDKLVVCHPKPGKKKNVSHKSDKKKEISRMLVTNVQIGLLEFRYRRYRTPRQSIYISNERQCANQTVINHR